MEDIALLRKKEFEYREQQLFKAQKQELKKKDEVNNFLHITYVMTWTGVCRRFKDYFRTCK